jgi:UDP-N-acetylmuramyl tripeptide synthase
MKLLITLLIGKFGFYTCKVLNLGTGYTSVGYFILKYLPFSRSFKFNNYKKVILITGTNGKSTTSKLVAHLLNDKYKVLHNSSGSNLLRGIFTTLILDYSFNLSPRSDICVLEVDEFALNSVVKLFDKIDYLVLLNLSRDQLDRFHEIENITTRWLDTLIEVDNLVVNSEDARLVKFAKHFKKEIYFFNSHDEFRKLTSLIGSFNNYNVNAAVNIFKNEISSDPFLLKLKLESFSPAFGRGEIINYGDNEYKIFLAKNPASFNLNLQLFDKYNAKYVIVILNDNIPDGLDVSWIYDISETSLFNSLKNKNVFITGQRGLDMAIRLRYAGLNIPPENVFSKFDGILKHFKELNIKKETIYVLPNYSAMLNTRKTLLGRKIL